VGLSDILRDVPGVYVQKKWGGDTRLSIRGSGIGNANHLRGTLLAQDGIPLNEADGYGDTQLVDPFLARYTEVYKGGNALRYGGALLGGAINMITPTARHAPEQGVLRLGGGDHGTAARPRQRRRPVRRMGRVRRRLRLQDQWLAPAERRRVAVRLRQSRLHLRRRSGSPRLRFRRLHPPADPGLGLARPGAQLARARKPLQRQRGTTSATSPCSAPPCRRAGASTPTPCFEGGVYATHKELDHPIFQVIHQESDNWGAFGRLDWTGELFGMKADMFYGASYRAGENDAKQWVNLAGSRGALTAQSYQDATGLDVFAEGRLFIMDGFALVAGGSYGRAERDYRSTPPSAIVVTDSETYDWFSPRVGFVWQNPDGMQVYGNVTRSVEPPNFGGLAPTTGGFQPLKEQDAVTAEIGTRGRSNNFVWDVALYRAEIDNELLTYSVNPGLGIPAATFNALNGTMHQGLEAGLDWNIMDGLRLRQTYMWSDFRFTDDPQYGDNSLPIVPEHFYRAELRGSVGDFWIAPSVEWSMSDAWTDYANTFEAGSYAIFNLNLGYEFENGPMVFLDVRNILDEKYVSNFTPVVNWNAATVAQRNIFFPGDTRSLYAGVAFTF
jgi:iron complex outermembrane receptor protein